MTLTPEMLGAAVALVTAIGTLLTVISTRRRASVDTAAAALDMYVLASDERFNIIETELARVEQSLTSAVARIRMLEAYIRDHGLEVPKS